jgi:hypothetical protein
VSAGGGGGSPGSSEVGGRAVSPVVAQEQSATANPVTTPREIASRFMAQILARLRGRRENSRKGSAESGRHLVFASTTVEHHSGRVLRGQRSVVAGNLG